MKGKKQKIFVVNGKGGAGKDTFVNFVIEALGEDYECSVISSVDKVKEAAKALGWDGAKDDKGRKFLSDLKDMSTALYDGPMKYMKWKIANGGDICFVMIREPIEIAKFIEEFPDAETVLIKRDGIEEFSNHADLNVGEYNYDMTIHNNGTIDEFRSTIPVFIDIMVKD